MRLLPTLAVLLALTSMTGITAAQPAGTSKPIGTSAAESQAAGAAAGAAALTSGPSSPSESLKAGTKPGADNVWGPAYTGVVDPALAGKQNKPSMIEIGNKATGDASAKFKGYNSDRDDQASQATYFLIKNPRLNPTLTSDDPMFRTDSMTAPPVFTSSASKICKLKTVGAIYDNTKDSVCTESYKPYVVSCAEVVNLTVNQEVTCDVGKPYFVEMNDSTGMGDDDCDGGDHLKVAWTCTAESYPTITMSTNSITNGTSSMVVPNQGFRVVQVDGNYCVAKFINDTTCTKGKCTGKYTMIIGTNDPIYEETPQCYRGNYKNSDESGTYYVAGFRDPSENQCQPRVIGYTFREHGFGSSARINSTGAFSMSKTVVKSTGTSTCAALEGLARP